MSAGKNDYILKTENISKHYGGLIALDRVHMDLRYGEVHAVVGENGAGKSTLMNILGGIVRRDSGKIMYKGKEVDFETPLTAMRSGIAIIHQELSMLPSLNVIENIFMGNMDSKYGIVLGSILKRKALQLLDQVGLQKNPYKLVGDLSISDCQLVEIAKALSQNASLIIMDEPNSSLTETETKQLFQVVKDLKKSGVSILYVSHKIEEVIIISDRITVLRDGKYIGTIDKKDASVDKVISMMVGRELNRSAVTRKHEIGEIVLDVRGISGEKFNNISFDVRKGEILGLSGLVGAGRSEVAQAIFGLNPITDGRIFLHQKEVRFTSPLQAIKKGIAMVPEDRKNLSLFTGLSIELNIAITELSQKSYLDIITSSIYQNIMCTFIDMLNIKMVSAELPVSSLSGGNQQKVVLSRWLATNPKLLILDEPTHGIDVGAKAEIYKLMNKLTQEGISIILISSELPEIILMSDRVVVLYEGKVTGVLNRDELTEDRIMAYSTGGTA
jgi:ribose transport system ATP-binding protein